MKGYFVADHEVLGPTYSSPSRRPWSLKILPISRRRETCCLKLLRYVSALWPGEIHVPTREAPARSSALASSESPFRPFWNDSTPPRKSTPRLAAPQTSFLVLRSSRSSASWLSESAFKYPASGATD